MLCGAKVADIALPYGGECFRAFGLSPTPAFARFLLATQQDILSAAGLLGLAEALPKHKYYYLMFYSLARLARRIVVGVVGATVVLLGIAMIVLPGPAFIVIPIGLAILGAEFAWAQRWLRLVKAKLQSVLNKGPQDQRKKQR